MGLEMDDTEGGSPDAWRALRSRAEAAVAASDRQLKELRDTTMQLSLERRRAVLHGGSGEAEPLSVVVTQRQAPNLPHAWDVGIAPSPRAHPLLLEDGARFAVEDSFTRSDGATAPLWWEATVIRRTGGVDALDRPVYDILFDDLEIQYADADGERVVHAEEGGPAQVVFLNDTVLLELASGEEMQYKRVRQPTDAGLSLLGTQVVELA
jgi:hypothetical protein